MTTQISPLDVGISLAFLRKKAPVLAQEIAIGLEAASKLAADSGLSELQWSVLKVWPQFVQLVRDAHEELSGYSGTMVKTQRKAAFYMAEMGVLDLVGITQDPKSNNKEKLDAIEQLRDIAGATSKGGRSQPAAAPVGTEAGGTVLGGPLIEIHLGDPAKMTIKEAPMIEGVAKQLPKPPV